MDYNEQMATCPMGRAFLSELDAAWAEGRGLDLTTLWKAAGRPRGRARHWLAGMAYAERVTDEGGGPDGRILTDPGTALLYAAHYLDRTGTLDAVWSAIFLGAIRADPAPMLVKEHSDLIALVARLDLMAGGMTAAEAGRHLIGRVKEHVAAATTDPWAEEGPVMRAQRALGGFDATGMAVDGAGRPLG